jgi:heavy metal translocating P-type ATPase
VSAVGKPYRSLLLAVAALGLAAGLGGMALGAPRVAEWALALATAVVLAALLLDIVRSFRRGEFGLDLVAALSMGGALALGELLAGAVIALMFAGGEFLEAFAQRRARREMTALLARLPRSATRHGPAGLEEVPLDEIRPGDRLLIRRGEVLPVDGDVAPGATAVLDESALTGEALPVRHAAGEAVLSGTVNAGEAFDLVATRRAAESSYAGIVRLVETAQRSKAPMARLADRWSLVFLALTLLLAAAAWWLAQDPRRALAVLVVATPCPLILAVPVAIIAGLSRSARAGVLVKSGGALETMARARVLLLDKTGTLTEGRARLSAILPLGAVEGAELLRLAASLDQASGHVLAAALVAEARARGLALETPRAVREAPGVGLAGEVGGRRVALGARGFVAAEAGGAALPAVPGAPPGAALVHVALDGAPAGVLVFEDTLRADATAVLRAARRAGIRRVVLVTGDQRTVAEAIAGAVGVDAVLAECSPQEKVAAVHAERRNGPVMMVGDGVNDAPALAAADIGIAMGARGAAASSEAADAVVLVDRLDRVPAAMRIARRARAIALQSVVAGIGLSTAGMLVAAAGWLSPVQGAVVQEVIDVAVILNALRALGGDGEEAARA